VLLCCHGVRYRADQFREVRIAKLKLDLDEEGLENKAHNAAVRAGLKEERERADRELRHGQAAARAETAKVAKAAEKASDEGARAHAQAAREQQALAAQVRGGVFRGR